MTPNAMPYALFEPQLPTLPHSIAPTSHTIVAAIEVMTNSFSLLPRLRSFVIFAEERREGNKQRNKQKRGSEREAEREYSRVCVSASATGTEGEPQIVIVIMIVQLQ